MAGSSNGDSSCRLGVLAFGDSITNGGGELQWGVALQSWALWVARALGLPFTSHAVDGAKAQDVVREQIPRFERTSADPHRRYNLGCVYVGVNDVRSPDWDERSYESCLRSILDFLVERCDRTLALSAPLDLGRPRAGENVETMNELIARAAGDHATVVVDLRDFGARNQVMTDHVHPTAFGQIAIAERALAVLAAEGVPTRVVPSSLISFETTRWRRLRADATYTYRHAKVSARCLALRSVRRRNQPAVPALTTGPGPSPASSTRPVPCPASS